MVNLSVELVSTTGLGYVYRFKVSGGVAGASVTLEKKNDGEPDYGFLGTVNLDGLGVGVNETFYATQYKGLNVNVRAVYQEKVVGYSSFVVGGGTSQSMMFWIAVLSLIITGIAYYVYKKRR